MKRRKPIVFGTAFATVAVMSYVVFHRLNAISGRVDIQGRLTIDLPNGSHHTIHQGIDTRVGTITLGGTRNELEYDIGPLAGNYADSEVFIWKKQEVNDSVEMHCLLQQSDAEKETLVVTFPELGPANFWTEIRDTSEVDAVLAVMRTVRPAVH